MSGLNISNYLSQMSGTNVPNNNNVSTLFGSLNNSKNNSSSANIFGASNLSNDMLGISYSDYASVKSGSYYKLMKKQYSAEGGQVDKEGIEAYKKQQDVTANKAASVSSTLNDLMDMKYTEDNRSDISDKVKKFVNEYNSLVKNAKSSDSSSVVQKSDWMNNMVAQYSDTLSKVGLSVNADKTLEIDENSLSKANISSLKDVFGLGVNSFSNKVLYKAEQIYSLAKTYGSSATAYTSSGTYNRNYASNYETTT